MAAEPIEKRSTAHRILTSGDSDLIAKFRAWQREVAEDAKAIEDWARDMQKGFA